MIQSIKSSLTRKYLIDKMMLKESTIARFRQILGQGKIQFSLENLSSEDRVVAVRDTPYTYLRHGIHVTRY